MTNVSVFPGATPLPFDADIMLDDAKGILESVVIVGEYEDGSEYFSSSVGNGPEVLWMLERAKLKLLTAVDGD